ncbi:oocyte zinc finger protein XlCOF19-like [Palaemon carinicauda]|uniref:oocyte zinc finger protein XlCOF19-like n=1 Tax=Palaemon carinicauda TaxID=392227 RepID=UPI0035B585E7
MPSERRYSMTLRKRRGEENTARRERKKKIKKKDVSTEKESDTDESPLPEEVAALLALSSRPLVFTRRRVSFPCSICRQRFPTEKKMMIHKSDHFREVPFACLNCFKTFRDFDLLQQHRESHRGFQCAICPKAFQDYSPPQDASTGAFR